MSEKPKKNYMAITPQYGESEIFKIMKEEYFNKKFDKKWYEKKEYECDFINE